jgi:hypothetical protein
MFFFFAGGVQQQVRHAVAEIWCGKVHSVPVAGRSGGLRKGPEDILRSGMAVTGEGASDVLQQLQTLLPSVLLSAAATDRLGGFSLALCQIVWG